MNELKVYLKDCYGIAEFDEVFDFTQGSSTVPRHSQTHLIYAQNGLMKSSLAKTFKNISGGDDPKELVYGKTSKHKIEVDGSPITPSSIFVVESKAQYFETDKMATLLADKKTQAEYATIVSKIDSAESEVFKYAATKLRVRSPVDAISRFDQQFGTDETNRLARILSLKEQVEKVDPKYLKVDYKLFEDTRVIAFLEKPETHVALRDYFETYDKLLEQSKYFKKDVFDYINGLNSYEALDKNNFLKVDNKIILSDGTEVTDVEELKRLFLEDKDRIFTDPKLKEQYSKLDDAMQKNAQLQGLRKFMGENKEFIPLMQNINNMRTSTWAAYLQESGPIYDQLVTAYSDNSAELKKIYEKSEALETEWQKIVDKFNKNFNAPFKVKIKNKRDSILNETKPVLEFEFTDGVGISKVIDIAYMNSSILSTGESRALYILCVMFEIESRKKASGDHLIIIDDIADSFDYKNKYAIIEYLHTISRTNRNGIHMIIMTHNFDFFRTVQMRFWGKIYREKTHIASRSNSGVIKLEPITTLFEFDRFRQELNRNEAIFIGCIAFVRNLIEYSQGASNTDYQLLTGALHIKPDTKTLTAEDILKSFDPYLKGVVTSSHGMDLYIDILERNAQAIALTPTSSKLEDKIVVAIALRLKAEDYMITQLVANDPAYIVDTTKDQTATLFEDFIGAYSDQDDAYPVLNRVMLMTPESIHINSFMYEPLLDMSLQELVNLKTDLDGLK